MREAEGRAGRLFKFLNSPVTNAVVIPHFSRVILLEYILLVSNSVRTLFPDNYVWAFVVAGL